jgi:hypothetical protein
LCRFRSVPATCVGPAASELHRSFVGSRPIRVRLRFLRMTAKVKIKVKVKSKIKNDGQECPSHTSKIKSCLQPAPLARFGPLPVTTLHWLPSVKSRGHVYPLSFLT